MASTNTTGAYLEQGAGIAGPPAKMRTNETIYWEDTPFNDRFNNNFDSNSYSLAYSFAGAGSTPVTVNAVPGTSIGGAGTGGGGWTSTFSAANAALMTAGLWWWQAILTAYTASFIGSCSGSTLTISGSVTGTIVQGATLNGAGIPAGVTIVSGSGLSWQLSQPVTQASEAMTTTQTPARIVAAEGEIVVEPDFSALTGTFDGRSVMEVGLANAEAALTQFQNSGGRIKHYTVAGRQMTFQDDKEIRELCDWFRARVGAEKMKASGGDSRNIRIGFAPPTSGIPTSNSRNWPWW